jgi:hypothetical protein
LFASLGLRRNFREAGRQLALLSGIAGVKHSSSLGMMSGVDELMDFLWSMEAAVREETALFEIPQGSWSGGRSYGPWPAATCSAVLKSWYQAGWVGIYFRDPPPGWNIAPAEWRSRVADSEDLSAQDALALFDQPERWARKEHGDGRVQPYLTTEGDITPRDQWYEHVMDLARSLPLKP